MFKVEDHKGNAIIVIGLQFRKEGDVSWAAIRPMMEAELLIRAKEGDPLVDIEMPCGQRLIYWKLEEIPFFDTPCPCGDPRHWLVKYEEVGP